MARGGKLHLPPAIERPVILYHISPPKSKIPVPTFHTTNKRSPKFKELRARKAEVREQYLRQVSRTRRLEASERRANIQLNATRRLRDAFEEKRKTELERKEAKTMLDEVRQEAHIARVANRSGEHSHREAARQKMEGLYMSKKAEVETVKDELKAIKDDHCKAKGELMTLNRQLIEKERQRARDQKIRWAEEHAAQLDKSREQQRLVREAEMQKIRQYKKAESEWRAKMAQSIKSTLKANQLNRNEKNIDKNLDIANAEVVSKKVENTELLLSFFQSEMEQMRTEETDYRRKLENHTLELKALQDEISGSFNTPIGRYHRKKYYPINDV